MTFSALPFCDDAILLYHHQDRSKEQSKNTNLVVHKTKTKPNPFPNNPITSHHGICKHVYIHTWHAPRAGERDLLIEDQM